MTGSNNPWQQNSTGAPVGDAESWAQLGRLLHANICRGREIQSNGEVKECSNCQTTRNVLSHLETCQAGKSCDVPYCSTSLQIISQWKNCAKSDCFVCTPFKRASRLQQWQAGQPKQQPNDGKSLVSQNGNPPISKFPSFHPFECIATPWTYQRADFQPPLGQPKQHPNDGKFLVSQNGNPPISRFPSFNPFEYVSTPWTYQRAGFLPPICTPVPLIHSQAFQDYIISATVQESQKNEDCFPESPSVREKQIFVKKEIACLAPDPSVAEHYMYSKSNYFSETTGSSKHPPKEKENLKIFKHTEAYMPEVAQQIINLYKAASLENPKMKNAIPLHPVCPSLFPSLVVKLEFSHTAIERKMPTEDYTHDFKVCIRGPVGCAIEHFFSTVAFCLPLRCPRPIRARREPPFKINVSGYTEFEILAILNTGYICVFSH